MQKQFVSNLTLLLLVNFLVKPLWIFGIDLQVQNEVGATAYGLYAAVFSFTMMFNILLDLGLAHYSNRSIAQNPERLSRNFSRLTTLKLFLGIIYLLVSFAIGWILGYWHQAFWLLLLLSVNQFLASLIVFFRSHLAGLHLFKADALMSVLDKSLTVLICGAVIYGGVFGLRINILLFAGLQTLSFGLAAIIGFFLVFRKTRLFTVRLRWREFAGQLKQSFPYALLILLMALYTRVDSVMLQQISGEFENGIYAQAYRLLDVVNQPGYLFSVLLLPMFSGMSARNEPVRDLSRLAFTLILVFTLAISIASAGSAQHLMAFLYHDHPELSTPVFQWLIFSSIAFGATYIFGTLLTARGDLRTLNRIALAGFSLNVILNFALIPTYGAIGAAFATVCTQFITAAVQLYFSFMIVRFHFEAKFWWRLLTFAILCAVLSLGLSGMEWLNWPLQFAAHVLLVLLLALFLRLLPVRAAIVLMRNRLKGNLNG